MFDIPKRFRYALEIRARDRDWSEFMGYTVDYHVHLIMRNAEHETEQGRRVPLPNRMGALLLLRFWQLRDLVHQARFVLTGWRHPDAMFDMDDL